MQKLMKWLPQIMKQIDFKQNSHDRVEFIWKFA
jgi:hypothetical protein